MNGLKYIRTRCNLSLNDLAEAIGVTRQALSSWENERKEIPSQRKRELSDFFGIEEAYFGDISEAEKKYLLEKAMFRYVENGKETYRYKPQDGSASTSPRAVWFLKDQEMSLDEKYVQAQNKKKEALTRIEDIIKWTNDAGSIESQISCINRGCDIYGMLTTLMEEMRKRPSYMKMPFFFELVNILKATLLSFDLLNPESLATIDRTQGYYCQEDGEWILSLADTIKAHWNAEQNFHESQHQAVRKQIKKENSDKPKNDLPLDEKITKAEQQFRSFQSENTDSDASSLTVFL